MSNDNTAATTATTAAASNGSNQVVKGQIIAGKVTKLLNGGFACLVELGNTGITGLLHKDQMDGGTHPGRKTNFGELKVGTEVCVEVYDVRPSTGPNDNRGRDKYDLSLKTIQEAAVLAELKPMTADAEGTKLTTVFDRLNAEGGYALLRVTEGPAKGYLVLLHATDCAKRDETLDELANSGDRPIIVEVKSIEQPKARKDDLRIKVTTLGDARRAQQKVLTDTTKVYKGTATRRTNGGVEVEFGPADAPMTGILPSGEVPAGLQVGTQGKDGVRVKILSVGTGQRGGIVLTRQGIK